MERLDQLRLTSGRFAAQFRVWGLLGFMGLRALRVSGLGSRECGVQGCKFLMCVLRLLHGCALSVFPRRCHKQEVLAEAAAGLDGSVGVGFSIRHWGGLPPLNISLAISPKP